MFLNDWKDYVINFAVVTTILQFLSGTLVCKQYVVNRTTAETSPLPFICGILSCAMWLLYGMLKHDDKIVLVNSVGVTLYIAYTIVFYLMTFKKATVSKQFLIMVLILLFTIWSVSKHEQNRQKVIDCLGLASCSLSLLTIVAPMSKLFYVMKVRNSECLPFPMILMSFFVSTLWFCYGIIINDPYLKLPNFIGCVLASLQLCLFIIFPNTSSASKTPKTILL